MIIVLCAILIISSILLAWTCTGGTWKVFGDDAEFEASKCLTIPDTSPAPAPAPEPGPPDSNSTTGGSGNVDGTTQGNSSVADNAANADGNNADESTSTYVIEGYAIKN